MKPVTRLTVANDIEGALNVTYDVRLSNGESVVMNFQIPKISEHASVTLHHLERSMLHRLESLAKTMLAN